MIQYLVTPTHKNGYEAPSILVDVDPATNNAYLEAEEAAKSKSRLSDSKNWYFKKKINKLKKPRFITSKKRKSWEK